MMDWLRSGCSSDTFGRYGPLLGMNKVWRWSDPVIGPTQYPLVRVTQIPTLAYVAVSNINFQVYMFTYYLMYPTHRQAPLE